MNLINLTHHSVVIYAESDTIYDDIQRRYILQYPVRPLQIIPPSGVVASVITEPEALDPINGIPTYLPTPSIVRNVPDRKPGVCLIVPYLVAIALPSRSDLKIPYKTVWSQGRVIGCCALAQLTK